MHIGILQTGSPPEQLIEKYGDYADMFVVLLKDHADFTFQIFKVSEGEMPDNYNVCDGWLITGSRFSAYEELPWISPLKALIQDIDTAKKPLLGICFGHQIIAEALGGKVEKSDKGWGLGLDTYKLNKLTPWPIDEGQQITLNIFHQDQVIKSPPGARIYAQSEFCDNAGFSISEHILTTQAHPEMRADYNRELLNIRQARINANDRLRHALCELEDKEWEQDSVQFAQWMGDFMRKAHEAKIAKTDA